MKQLNQHQATKIEENVFFQKSKFENPNIVWDDIRKNNQLIKHIGRKVEISFVEQNDNFRIIFNDIFEVPTQNLLNVNNTVSQIPLLSPLNQKVEILINGIKYQHNHHGILIEMWLINYYNELHKKSLEWYDKVIKNLIEDKNYLVETNSLTVIKFNERFVNSLMV